MHELALTLIAGAIDDATKTAIVVGLFGLMSLTLTFLFDKSRRPPPPPPPPVVDEDDELLHSELLRRAKAAERRVGELETETRQCAADTRRYREWLIHARINPDTGERLDP